MINIKECRIPELPKSASVACQGIEGAYSQMAANALFVQPDITYVRTFDGVFSAVDKGLCRYGVLPLENSNAGSVASVYDLMKAYDFYIVRSVKLTIAHRLLANEKTAIENIKEIFTHEQAAAQCSKFIEDNPRIKFTPCDNTAIAAKLVAESGKKKRAAIASENCAALYGLKILAKNVENNKHNYTRFICISKKCEICDNSDKISLMLALEHKAGALYEVIARFAEYKINLTKIESRPIADTDFEFMFYFDMDANIETGGIYDLLESLRQTTRHFVFLGNYSEITQGEC